jgi:peptide/nickel transport system substrate-binding protein
MQAAALSGDVDIAPGSITLESVNAYRSIKQNRFVSYDSAGFEHLDLRVAPVNSTAEAYTGPFAGNSARARDLRAAFLLAFPREEILEKVILPIAPHAKLPQSFLRLEKEEGHDEVASQSGFISKYSWGELSRQATAQNIVRKHFPAASATKYAGTGFGMSK